jgi:hypothetical protein
LHAVRDRINADCSAIQTEKDADVLLWLFTPCNRKPTLHCTARHAAAIASLARKVEQEQLLRLPPVPVHSINGTGGS